MTRYQLPNGLTLNAVVAGDGPVLVWMAGLGDDHTSWRSQVEHFATDYTCVALDNRGCGDSDVPAPPYSVSEMAADAHDLVTVLGFPRVTAIGSSMGGAIVQEWALRYPDDLDQIVLTNTWASQDAHLNLIFEHWLHLADRGVAADLQESCALFTFGPDFYERGSDRVAQLLNAPLSDFRGLIGGLHACRAHHTQDRLAGISHRCLVIAGTQDTLTRPQLAQRLADGLTHSTLARVEAGHMICWEQPEQFSELVRTFLESGRE